MKQQARLRGVFALITSLFAVGVLLTAPHAARADNATAAIAPVSALITAQDATLAADTPPDTSGKDDGGKKKKGPIVIIKPPIIKPDPPKK